jgi:small multidrug resistance family-3 protein
MLATRTVGLFVVTALAEIVGCYLPYLWLRRSHSAWLLVPAAFSLVIGAAVTLVGMAIMAFAPRT